MYPSFSCSLELKAAAGIQRAGSQKPDHHPLALLRLSSGELELQVQTESESWFRRSLMLGVP